MSALAALWSEYGTAIQWGIGAVGGWFGAIGQYRLRSQSNRLSAGDQALRMVKASQEREVALTASYERIVTLEATARAHAVATAETLQTVYEQAIGARLQVHAMEALAGHALSVFPPLPPFPLQEILPSISPDEVLATGDQAASTADPGADNTHR